MTRLWKTTLPSEGSEALLETREDLPTGASNIASGGHVSAATCASLNWFAVYTISRHEKRIAQHLGLRNIEYFLPLYNVRRKWNDGSNVTLNLPLFPGYVFVRTTRDDRVRVLEIPSVLWIASSKREPTPVPDTCIESLMEAVRLQRIEPHPYLVIGEKVRIKNGAMGGMEGILVRKKNSFRVVITLEMIFQSMAVEVDAENLEPVSTSLGGR